MRVCVFVCTVLCSARGSKILLLLHRRGLRSAVDDARVCGAGGALAALGARLRDRSGGFA